MQSEGAIGDDETSAVGGGTALIKIVGVVVPDVFLLAEGDAGACIGDGVVAVGCVRCVREYVLDGSDVCDREGGAFNEDQLLALSVAIDSGFRICGIECIDAGEDVPGL